MQDPQKITAQIKRLVSAFPPSSTAAPDEVLRRYFEAIEGVSADDLEAAVTLFVQGRVPGQNLSFAPTPPELASAVRRAGDQRATASLRITSAVQQIEARDRDEEIQAAKTDESRERVKAMAAKLIADLAQQSLTDDAKAAHRKREAWAKVNARFAPKDEAEHIRRLGYSVGDPDGDADAA
jgi:hypothetical protein